MKKLIGSILCLFWLSFIFYMSSRPGLESHNMSKAIVSVITNNKENSKQYSAKEEVNKSSQNTKKANNSSNIKQPSNNNELGSKNELAINKKQNVNSNSASSVSNKTNIAKKSADKKNSALDLDYVIRKNAHALEYIILSILVSSSFFAFNRKGKGYIVYILFICLFYAVTDEFHQAFVPGRTSLASDVLIDFCGAIVGTAAFYFIYYKVFKRIQDVNISTS